MQMQKVQVELIRDGDAINQVDPLAKQYMALAGSIILLCKEDNIDDIVLKYIEEMEPLKQNAPPPKRDQKKETPYSAALEVLTHSILHMVGKDEVKNIDQQSLMSVIDTIRGMFEEELQNPEAIAKKRSAGIEDVPLLFKGAQEL